MIDFLCTLNLSLVTEKVYENNGVRFNYEKGLILSIKMQMKKNTV